MEVDVFYIADPKLRKAPLAPGERRPRVVSPKQRLANIVSGLLWAIQKSHPVLSEEEIRSLLGSALRRNRAFLMDDIETNADTLYVD